MAELAAGDSQTVADFAQTLGLGQLAKEHGDILVPAGKAFGVTFCTTSMKEQGKRVPRHDLEDLAEQTCGKLHSRDSFEVFGDYCALTILLRGVSPLPLSLKTYFGQE